MQQMLGHKSLLYIPENGVVDVLLLPKPCDILISLTIMEAAEDEAAAAENEPQVSSCSLDLSDYMHPR